MRVLLFAQVRELIGAESIEIELTNASETTPREIIDKISSKVEADASL